MFEFSNVFFEMTMILLLAAVVGAIGNRLKQPLIVSFIAVGIIVGPSALGIIHSHEQIELLAEIGIAVLLFIVGLKLDVTMIRTMGPVALATGLGQVLFTSVFGFLIALGLGMDTIPAVYVAVALTFSSTIIIVKLLSDKREIDSLHGRIAVGFLIVQDIMVIVAMIGLSALGAGTATEDPIVGEIIRVAVYGAAFIAGVVLMMRYVLPVVMPVLARSQELLVLFSVAWAVSLAALGDYLGFSKEVGAFMAGIALASSPYRDSIGTRMVTLRDFLLLFFFIDLGARLDLSLLGAQLPASMLFSAFVLVGNPLIVMAIMGAMGYRKRTGFLAGLTVAQISEFSLILAALGVSLGHLDDETMGLITLVGLITIGLSTYMILYSGKLYQWLAPYLDFFERKVPYRETAADIQTSAADRVDVILFGLGNYGGNIAHNLAKRHKSVVGVDFDPSVLKRWRDERVPVIYGDAGDPELLEHLPIGKASWVVLALPDRDTNLSLLEMLGSSEFRGKLVAAARTESEADLFRSRGADVIVRPFVDAAEAAVDSMTTAMHALPEKMAWATTLREVRLHAGSVFAGKAIGEIPLRAETGASILAVSRAGKSFFDPGPNFRLYPGDRLVLLGDKDNLRDAVEYLDQREDMEDEDLAETFAVGEVQMLEDSQWVGNTLASCNIRRDFGVTIIGIERGDRQINAPSAHEQILAGDRLIVAGNRESVERLVAADAPRDGGD